MELGSEKYGYFIVLQMFSLYYFEFYWGINSVWQLGLGFRLGARITEGDARLGLHAVMKSLIVGIAIMKQRCVFMFASAFKKRKLRTEILLFLI